MFNDIFLLSKTQTHTLTLQRTLKNNNQMYFEKATYHLEKTFFSLLRNVNQRLLYSVIERIEKRLFLAEN